MSAFAVSGVHAAAVTPLDRDGAADTARLARLCRWLLRRGCDGVVLLGSTGEANSFSVEERIGIIEAVAAAGVPGETLVIGVGCCAVPDTVRLCRAARAAGAGAVLMSPPFYYKGVSDDGQYAAFAAVAEAVADPGLKVVLYHFPQLSGVAIGPALIERLRRGWPDTFVGIKDSAGDAAAMIATVQRFPGFAVLCGGDDLFWPVLRQGGAGCITAVANVASPSAAEVQAAWRRGDPVGADAVHRRLSAVRKVFAGYPLTAALKATFAGLTGDSGWTRIRPPLTPLDPAAAATLAAALDALPDPLFDPGDGEGL